MNVARLHRLLPVAALAVLSVFMSMVTRTALAWLAGAVQRNTTRPPATEEL